MLLEWIETAADKATSRIDRRTAQYLAESLFPQTWDRKPANPRFDRPPDMALLHSEIGKLALAAHPGPIEIRHIAELVPGGADQRLFRFIDAAMRGDLRAALIEQERLAAAGEEPAMTLSQLLGQLELAAIAQAAGNRDATAVARDLGAITPARMSAVMSSIPAAGRPGPSGLRGRFSRPASQDWPHPPAGRCLAQPDALARGRRPATADRPPG